MGRYLITAILAFLILFPAGARSEEAKQPPVNSDLFGTFTPEPGAWSEYGVSDKATGDRTVMRTSIVGTEGESYWYEVVTREGEKRYIVKMLVTGNPNIAGNIRRLIVKADKNPAMEMPGNLVFMGRRMASDMFRQRSGITIDSKVELHDVKKGEGVVTVPAGTFNVEQYQVVDTNGKVYAEYTFSREVHPFGIVSVDAEKKSILLEGYGTGAKSLITEKPAMMSLPPGMKPEAAPPEGTGPGPEGNIRQIPGMGTGYEPRQ
jgi:hypothetical protein